MSSSLLKLLERIRIIKKKREEEEKKNTTKFLEHDNYHFFLFLTDIFSLPIFFCLSKVDYLSTLNANKFIYRKPSFFLFCSCYIIILSRYQRYNNCQ